MEQNRLLNTMKFMNIMSKNLIIALCAICVSISMFADDRELQIRKEINYLDSIYTTLPPKKQQDTLWSIVEHYRLLDTLLTESIANRDSLLQRYTPYQDVLFLLSRDTSVFLNTYSEVLSIPQSLNYHFHTIQMIISAREQIESIEKKVNNIVDNYAEVVKKTGQAGNLKSDICREIEPDMDILYSLIKEIKQRDLSSLTPQQYEYFKPGLTERYNNFIKYFE